MLIKENILVILCVDFIEKHVRQEMKEHTTQCKEAYTIVYYNIMNLIDKKKITYILNIFFPSFFTGPLWIKGGGATFGWWKNDGQPPGWNSQTLYCQTHCEQRTPLAQGSWKTWGFDHQFWYRISWEVIEYDTRHVPKSFARKIITTTNKKIHQSTYHPATSIYMYTTYYTYINLKKNRQTSSSSSPSEKVFSGGFGWPYFWNPSFGSDNSKYELDFEIWASEGIYTENLYIQLTLKIFISKNDYFGNEYPKFVLILGGSRTRH